MGYKILVLETNFQIVAENADAALAGIKGLYKQQSIEPTHNFAFVTTKAVLDTSDIYNALSEWRWLPLVDNEGNIQDIEFTGEKLGDEQILFDALATFVKPGSFIVVAGEDGKVWRWRFDEKCHYEIGKIIF